MAVRLRGAALFSWLGLAALLLFVGVLLAVTPGDGEGWGLALAVVGVTLGWRIITMRAVVDADGLMVRNLIRRITLRWDEVAELRSTVTETPMTRAMGWRCLEVVNDRGVKIALTATTGASPGVMTDLLAHVAAHASRTRAEVDPTVFPVLNRSTRKR